MTEPFSSGYFEWQKYAESKGFNVVTIVTRDDLDLPLASGAVKVMAKTLQKDDDNPNEGFEVLG